MSLSRDIRKAIESGSASYAVVEAVYNGFVTVKIIGSNQRITNLEYIGAYEPEEGKKVILDYSAGQKPVVRPIEREYVGTEPEYTMQDKWDEPEVDPGILVASVDVGMGCTVNAQGFYFPNEPHDPHNTWIQNWGYNTAAWTSSIYDTMLIYGEPVLVGKQYFTISISGKYLLTFHTSLHLAGGGYSGDPYGTLTAFIYRLGSYGPFPIMVGTATAAGYNSYYNIDISKVMYLPEDDQVYVELMYTAGVNGYALMHSTNPLKWLAAGNDLTFKIQLLAETTIVEPPPEVSEFEGLARRIGFWGTIVEQGMDTSTKELTGFILECTDVTESQNYTADVISDNEFIYGICNDQLYGQYQMWKVDPDEGTAIYVEVADGTLLEQANRIALADTGIASYLWQDYFSWTSDPDDTAMTIKYQLMDWSSGDTESEISTLETFDVPWAPPLTGYDYVWGQTNKSPTGYLTVTPFNTGLGNVATYNDKNYVIARANRVRRTSGWAYYSSGMKWRIYDISDSSYTDITYSWSEENFGAIRDTGWFQYDNAIYNIVNRYYGVGATQTAVEIHVIDLENLTLTVYDITSEMPTGYAYLSGPVFDYVRGRIYAYETEDVIHSAPWADSLVYWDVTDHTYNTVDSNSPPTSVLPAGYEIISNKYNVYANPLVYSGTENWEYFNCTSKTQTIDCGDESQNKFVCPQVSSDEDRIWVLDMTAGSRKLIGYHRTEDARELSLENTAIGDLPDVYWNCRINLIGNAFIITLDHSTQGTHWYIIKPRI